MHEFISHSIQDTQEIATDFAKNLKPGTVVCLTGNLGAGKTAFVSCVASALGIKEDIVSPTFNILLVYKNNEVTINHFDLYRMETEQDLEDIGFYEIIEDTGISFIEWPDKFKNCMPSDAINITIDRLDDTSRKITIFETNSRN